MIAGMNNSWMEGALEALLFVTDEPVNAVTLADMLECEPSEVIAALVALRARLSREESGIQLAEVAGGWRLVTHSAFHDLIERYVVSWDTRKLSQAALETLAIIAYAQPVTRVGVSAVRGVSSDSSINSLVEKGLVREAGHDDSPGNPVLYATTKTFLEKFGLASPKDLPPLEGFAPNEETRALIAERLGATRAEIHPVDEDADLYDVDDSGTPKIHFTGIDSNASDEEQYSSGSDAVLAGDPVQAAFDVDAAMQEAMNNALGSAAGVVDKIDINSLDLVPADATDSPGGDEYVRESMDGTDDDSTDGSDDTNNADGVDGPDGDK